MGAEVSHLQYGRFPFHFPCRASTQVGCQGAATDAEGWQFRKCICAREVFFTRQLLKTKPKLESLPPYFRASDIRVFLNNLKDYTQIYTKYICVSPLKKEAIHINANTAETPPFCSQLNPARIYLLPLPRLCPQNTVLSSPTNLNSRMIHRTLQFLCHFPVVCCPNPPPISTWMQIHLRVMVLIDVPTRFCCGIFLFLFSSTNCPKRLFWSDFFLEKSSSMIKLLSKCFDFKVSIFARIFNIHWRLQQLFCFVSILLSFFFFFYFTTKAKTLRDFRKGSTWHPTYCMADDQLGRHWAQCVCFFLMGTF